MRYFVKGRIIRSENAAKPAKQASKAVVAWIRRSGPWTSGLDYGCGKLRYSQLLATSCRHLTLVDSSIQLTRAQRLHGTVGSIEEFARRRWPNSRTLSLSRFERDKRKYGFVLCANVLSAIPCANTRGRVLRRLAKSLSINGVCLIVVQHRNSDFARMRSSPLAIKHLDGWILNSRRGASFYGVVTRDYLVRSAARAGHLIVDSWVSGESTFVLTKRQS